MAKRIDAKNPDNILLWGDDFSEAYTILEAHNVAIRTKKAAGRECDFSSIVCLAFSQEMYLKALLGLSEGEYPAGHNVKVLFDALSPDIRAKVKVELRKHDPNLNDVGFDRCMSDNANAFETWRYAFEHLDREFSHFTSFAFDLNKALRTVYWDIYRGRPVN